MCYSVMRWVVLEKCVDEMYSQFLYLQTSDDFDDYTIMIISEELLVMWSHAV